jgi:hypothetical protein
LYITSIDASYIGRTKRKVTDEIDECLSLVSESTIQFICSDEISVKSSQQVLLSMTQITGAADAPQITLSMN